MSMREQIPRKPAAVVAPPLFAPAPRGILQRKCACGGSEGECDECKKKQTTLQRSSRGQAAPGTLPPIVHDVLRSPGHPLDPATRAFLEPRFGHDFSRVRIHADGRAAESARAVNAQAFTVGQEIVFGAGYYAPTTTDGRHLIAHELAHVVQQRYYRGGLQGARLEEKAPGVFEQAAEKAAEDVVHGRQVDRQPSVGETIQRDPEGTPATAACGPMELFTELSMPIGIDNNYFRGDQWKEKSMWKSELEAVRKDKCEAKGQFKNVKLNWDLGNPKLGTYYFINLNKNDMKFDINTHVIYARKPCCPCFAGNASWSFDVAVSRTKGGKTESGKTTAPITGTADSKKCEGASCCDVNQTMNIGMTMGDKELTATIKGKVTIVGHTFAS